MEKVAAVKGRPREFCVDMALAAALRVFWAKGYDGASMNDLTEAMGITKPSLYAAFGNKESLFEKALDLYESEKMAYVGEALAAPTARGVAERLMMGALEMQTAKGEPCGCMAVISTVAQGPGAEHVREHVAARGATIKRAIIARFERAQAEGDLPANIDPEGLATYLTAVNQGMAVQAGAGATREQLKSLIDTSLSLWPSK